MYRFGETVSSSQHTSTSSQLINWFLSLRRYSEEVFSQHSRRHSNDTNSDLSDGEIFSPDERRKSKAGEILASPTHRKITPTNISGTSSLSSPKRASRRSSQHDSNAPSNGHKESAVEHLHEFYRKQINDLKRSNDETIKHLNYKLQSRQSDDEYTVSAINYMPIHFIATPNTFSNLLTKHFSGRVCLIYVFISILQMHQCNGIHSVASHKHWAWHNDNLCKCFHYLCVCVFFSLLFHSIWIFLLLAWPEMRQ